MIDNQLISDLSIFPAFQSMLEGIPALYISDHSWSCGAWLTVCVREYYSSQVTQVDACDSQCPS